MVSAELENFENFEFLDRRKWHSQSLLYLSLSFGPFFNFLNMIRSKRRYQGLF
jgi:hypothetical protein